MFTSNWAPISSAHGAVTTEEATRKEVGGVASGNRLSTGLRQLAQPTRAEIDGLQVGDM